MRNSLALLIIVIAALQAMAQNVAINASGAPAHPSAILDLTSDDKGLLIPRMSTSQREAIASPSTGLIVYDVSTRSLWVHDGSWKEIASSGNMGTAGGDLYGEYPDPLVGKIQGQTVSALTPEDGQVLKWDVDEYMWKGMNDSLSLPFAAEANHGAYLFSLNNTHNSFAPSTTIRGQRFGSSGINLQFNSAIWGDAASGAGVVGSSITHPGVWGQSVQTHGVQGISDGGNGTAGVLGFRGASGFVPATTMGVWGNNQNGMGVVGSSATNVGVYGIANMNHGVFGYSASLGWAGIKGSHAQTGGIGIHGDVSNGIAMLGEAQNGGVGVYGILNGNTGSAGKFRTTSEAHSDTTLVARSEGTGKLGVFHVANVNNDEPGIKIHHEGGGDGLSAVLNKFESNAKAVNAVSNGNATALYGRSQFGIAGKFEILNVENPNPAVVVNNAGLGKGLDLISTQGDGVKIAVTGASAASRPLTVTNSGTGTTSLFKNLNATSDSSVVRIDQPGLGHGLNVIIGNNTSDVAGLSLVSAADWGIASTVFGKHAIHGNALAAYGIGVEGNAQGNYGIGVQGEAFGAHSIGIKGVSVTNNEGIGVLGDASQAYPGIGVKGIGASVGVRGECTSEIFGYGVIGEAEQDDPYGIGVKGSAGNIGVYGETTKAGTGVYAVAGSGGQNSRALHVENIFSGNTSSVMKLSTNGLATGIDIYSSNVNCNFPIISMSNTGSGAFLMMSDQNANMIASVQKSGNITTIGNITVKDNKGIVRNSSSTQLRVETLTAVFDADPYETLAPQEVRDIPVTFATAFTSAPAVYVANITQNGNASVMLVSVINVTTTGCTLHIMNPVNQNVALFDSTWKLVAMGAE